MIYCFCQGKAYTSIEPEDTKLNNLQVFPNSGLLFMANEAPKIQVYYIPVSTLNMALFMSKNPAIWLCSFFC